MRQPLGRATQAFELAPWSADDDLGSQASECGECGLGRRPKTDNSAELEAREEETPARAVPAASWVATWGEARASHSIERPHRFDVLAQKRLSRHSTVPMTFAFTIRRVSSAGGICSRLV
jgi:hypothetical protein